jgi:hypothetical protein
MTTEKPSSSPALQALKDRLEQWRSTRNRGRGRIPEAIWDEATNLALHHGVSRVSTRLRLGYDALKRRVDTRGQEATLPSPPSAGPAFLEVAGIPSSPSPPGCLLELENGSGCKLTIRLEGPPSFDLVALTKAFWGGRP